MELKKFGSLCSGIEAASLSFSNIGMRAAWFSEIADAPKKFLSYRYPGIRNLGDMRLIADMLHNGEVEVPDMLCGGCPCQAFSHDGLRLGLADERGQLTLEFFRIADEIDAQREKAGKGRALLFWENVYGVLSSEDNAFGLFLTGLSGSEKELRMKKWTTSGYVSGPKRNVAWRVLDSKFFGTPQQRLRIYVLAGGKDFRPDKAMFELDKISNYSLNIETHNYYKSLNGFFDDKRVVEKSLDKFEVFQPYTTTLLTNYGQMISYFSTFDGYQILAQNDRIRRFSNIEAERLMGFPDDWTNVPNISEIERFHTCGNSWVCNVIKFISKRIGAVNGGTDADNHVDFTDILKPDLEDKDLKVWIFKNDHPTLSNDFLLNTSMVPNTLVKSSLFDIIDYDLNDPQYFLSKNTLKSMVKAMLDQHIRKKGKIGYLPRVKELCENSLLYYGG